MRVKDCKRLEAIAFTDRGEALAKKLMEKTGGSVCRSGQNETVREWTKARFAVCDGLVFVGAAGIAVRAVAPYTEDKTKDPAVIVIDEDGRFVIPILSGHLGGANDLARELAEICEGQAVITTATDVRGLFAVDEWAKRQGCHILEPERIQTISSGILSGKTVTVRSPWHISGKKPPECMLTEEEEADIAMDIRIRGRRPIHLVPRICTLGIGCRKGTTGQALEEFFQSFISETGVSEKAIETVASIDMKAEEPGLKEFCEDHGWKLVTFSAAGLKEAKGRFTPSTFVSEVTGVDNVCERSAVLASSGTLIQKKRSGNGITMALAVREYSPGWRWTDE